MEDDGECITGLHLGLGMGGHVPRKEKQKENKPEVCLELAFELCPKGEAIDVNHNKANRISLERIHEYPNEKSTDSDNSNNKNGCRKKLRLTKEQSAMLENTFKLHSTLNPVQKQALADQLNLKTRQVEVWFQNRRARTKLKQTEVDRELLKKHCQNLSDENKRLKKELQELRALKVGPSPLCIQLSKTATLTMCSSCEKLIKLNEAKNNIELESRN
ncbi:homeobox-leucine zipper protein HAT22-like [Abrus precatorius]|uniref:Homeobox-leucine zipper protein HAT22-like n=1 Tax=Abrus precatorius TaxID=3816 RepID=A0A8B8JPY1_ABRPR|nr:homeobox-leucine zipper protein HAT22-like [Abrus precatorius]